MRSRQRTGLVLVVVGLIYLLSGLPPVGATSVARACDVYESVVPALTNAHTVVLGGVPLNAELGARAAGTSTATGVSAPAYGYDDIAPQRGHALPKGPVISSHAPLSRPGSVSAEGIDSHDRRALAALGAPFATEDAAARLPQDVDVNPTAPRRLPLDRPVGGSATQNEFVQNRIGGLQEQGATDFRVNQQQVDINGTRVGVNRPDLQYTLNGQRYYEEFDTSLSTRGPGHGTRIQANDPLGIIELFTVN